MTPAPHPPYDVDGRMVSWGEAAALVLGLADYSIDGDPEVSESLIVGGLAAMAAENGRRAAEFEAVLRSCPAVRTSLHMIARLRRDIHEMRELLFDFRIARGDEDLEDLALIPLAFLGALGAIDGILTSEPAPVEWPRAPVANYARRLAEPALPVTTAGAPGS